MTKISGKRIKQTGSRVIGLCVLAIKMCVSVCGGENWPMMVVVLFMKNVAKSSAVRVDEGRGGGLKIEEKVLKSMRESE